MRILVADDEDMCRALLHDLYIGLPHVELVMARDGAEAWWLMTEPNEKFDVAVIDVKMPVVDGLKLIERMRGTAHLRQLPVILCSGISDRETVGRAVRLGITSYIVKPYSPEGMREKIRAAAA